MRRRLRLFFIFLLEFQVFLLMVFVYIGGIALGVGSFGWIGIILGFVGASVINCSIGGLIFVLLELYYSLRLFETILDEEIRPILEKIARIEYRIYELFYDQFTAGGGEETGAKAGADDSNRSNSLGHR